MPPNKRMKLTKRQKPCRCGLRTSIVAESRFAACSRCSAQADVIVVQTHTSASCRGGARSDKGCDDPGHRGVAQ